MTASNPPPQEPWLAWLGRTLSWLGWIALCAVLLALATLFADADGPSAVLAWGGFVGGLLAAVSGVAVWTGALRREEPRPSGAVTAIVAGGLAAFLPALAVAVFFIAGGPG